MKRIIAMVGFLVIMAAISSSVIAAEPLGYPWSTWGELSQTLDGPEDGLKFDGYIEQGVDWFNLKSTEWILNTFVGLRFTQSDHDRYWDNKIGPWFGIKLKHDFQLFEDSWGQINAGIRREYMAYTEDRELNDYRNTVVSLQFSFGGDWKKR